jgi:murein DD-endopeptidase MepM/ murein hydrolase activator NlpD
MLASFLAGTLAGMLLMAGFRETSPLNRAPTTATVVDDAKPADIQPVLRAAPAVPPAAQPSIDDAIDDLRDRDLRVPVDGVTRKMLRDSFDEARDKIREHEAIDILAPRRTPVLAVEDGTIVKFFTSQRGGLTIYQFDESQTYCYYYAHLDGYAAGLSEGDRVKQGQTIGFVGTSGNAPPNTPHLHFAIFLLTEKKQWWQGTPVNPYDVWKK